MKKSNWIVILPSILIFMIIILIGYIYFDKSLDNKKDRKDESTTTSVTTTEKVTEKEETVEETKADSITFTLYDMKTSEGTDYEITDKEIISKVEKAISNAIDTGDTITGIGLGNIKFTLNYTDGTSVSYVTIGDSYFIYWDSNVLYETTENIGELLKSSIN